MDIPHERQRQQRRRGEYAQQGKALCSLLLLLAAAPLPDLRAHTGKTQRAQKRPAFHAHGRETNREHLPAPGRIPHAENAAERAQRFRGSFIGETGAVKLRRFLRHGKPLPADAALNGGERNFLFVVHNAAHPGGIRCRGALHTLELCKRGVQPRGAHGAVQPRYAQRDLTHRPLAAPFSPSDTRGTIHTSTAGTAPEHGTGRSS